MFAVASRQVVKVTCLGHSLFYAMDDDTTTAAVDCTGRLQLEVPKAINDCRGKACANAASKG